MHKLLIFTNFTFTLFIDMFEIILGVLIILGIISTSFIDNLCKKALKELRKEQLGYDWRVRSIAKDRYVIENKKDMTYLNKDLKIVNFEKTTVFTYEIKARYTLERFMKKKPL